MKKIYFILAILILSASCMGKYENQVKDLANRIEALESKIPTIEDQVAAIKQSINLLNDVDKALQTSISALDSADKELENSDQSLKSIQNELTTSLQQLQQYVDDELIGAENWVNTTIMTLEQYNSLVSTIARLENTIESNGELASQELTEAIDALNDSFKSWVGEQLLGYYIIAKADAEFDEVRKSIKEGDERLQGEINDLESQITSAAATLTEAYENAIKEVIEEYNGTIPFELTMQLNEVNARLNTEIAAINAKLATLEAQINQNQEDVAKLLSRIQSLSYIHKYDDGKATMVCSPNLYYSRLSFEVSPKDAVTALEQVRQEVISAKALGQGAGEEQFISLSVELVEADAESGTITLQLSGNKLPESITATSQDLQVAIQISDGNTAIVSDYIAVVKKDFGNSIIYSTRDGNIFEPAADAFDANIVSNTYDKEENIGIITFDSPTVVMTMANIFIDRDFTMLVIPESIISPQENPFFQLATIDKLIINSNIVENLSWDMFNVVNVLKPFNSFLFFLANIKHIVVGDNVTKFGWGAFVSPYLESVTIGSNVTDVGNAFAWCPQLKAFYGKFASEDNRSLINDGKLLAVASAELTEYTIPEGITEIGDYAFSGRSSLTSVTIPDSVTSIGSSAFRDCSSLTSVTIPDSVTSIESYTFQDCSSLTSVTIPNSVTSIGDDAFSGCSSLTSVTIPDSVTTIGSSAFYDCSSLTTVYLMSLAPPSYSMRLFDSDTIEKIYVYEESVNAYKKAWSKYADKIFSMGSSGATSVVYYDCGGSLLNVQLDSTIIKRHSPGVIVLEKQEYYNFDNAFANNPNLKSITLPNGVTSISGAFKGCSSLTSITIPDSVTTIGDYAFYNCSSLTSVTIPDSVTTIGSSAFYNCSRLTSVYVTDLSAWCKINFEDSDANPLYYAKKLYLNNELVTDLVIPSDITEIKNYAFYKCNSLTSVTIGDGVTSIGERAFYACSSLTSITIPDSVTSIGECAFYNCSSLTSVIIGDSVTTIGSSAFSDCSSLTSVTIGDSVTEIGYKAFYGCSSLTSVTIPNSVTTIENYAFRNCSSLTSVTIPDSVTSIGKGAFGECHSLECFYGRWVSEDNRCLVVNGVLISFAPASLAVSDSTGYTIPDGVTKIGEYAFCGCTLLTYITIPVNVTSIGNYAFDGCRKLSNLYFKDGDKALRQIGAYAFRNTNFLSLNFPSSVTSIVDYAFYDCDSLLSVVIGTGLNSIGVAAFADCSNLHTFACAAYSVPSTNGYDPFASCPYYLDIYVRKGLVSSYKNTWPWSNRSDYIKAATFTEK